MRHGLTTLLLLVALTCNTTAAGRDPVVTVFTLSTIPVTIGKVPDVLVHHLDQVERAMASIKFSLAEPASPNAEVLARVRLNALLDGEEGERLMTNFRQGFRGLVDAWRFDITELPAVLVNDRYIIYGVRNVEAALEHYRQAVR